MILPTGLLPSVAYFKTNILPKPEQTDINFAAIQTRILAEVEATNPSSGSNMAGKYDPTHCTFDEFCTTVKTLQKEGKLTMHDVLLTTVDFTRSFRENPNFQSYVTPTDQAGRRNWVNEFAALANREYSRGNMLGYTRQSERKTVALKVTELYLPD
jgi:hypothetical protein